jgi:hypothetical protein
MCVQDAVCYLQPESPPIPKKARNEDPRQHFRIVHKAVLILRFGLPMILAFASLLMRQ